MNNQPTKTHLQKQSFKEMPQIQLLNLEQLDSIVGGSVYKVSDITLKRGLIN